MLQNKTNFKDHNQNQEKLKLEYELRTDTENRPCKYVLVEIIEPKFKLAFLPGTGKN